MMLARKAGFSMGSPDQLSMCSAESDESEEEGAARRAAFLEGVLGMARSCAVDSVVYGQPGDATLHRCRVQDPLWRRGQEP